MINIVKFGADGSAYSKTLKGMRGETSKFSSSVSSLLKGAFAYVGVAGLRQIGDEFVQISRQAAKLGIGVESFQKLSKVAGQFGINSETLGDAIKDLNVKITDGSMGAKAYAEVFEWIGLSLADVAKMSPEEQFYALADAVAAADGNLSRFALDEINDAMFQIGPMMQLGSKRIKEMADAYGVLSKAQIDALVKADQMMASMTGKFKTLVGGVMAKYARMASDLADIFDKLDKRGGGGGPDTSGPSRGLPRDMSSKYNFIGGKWVLKDEFKDKPEEEEEAERKLEDIAPKSDAQIKLEGAELKTAEAQEALRQQSLTDEQKYIELIEKRKKVEAELLKLGEKLYEEGATQEEAIKLEELKVEWLKLQNEELKAQVKLKKQLAGAGVVTITDAEGQVDDQIEDWQNSQDKIDADKKKEDAAAAREKDKEAGLSAADLRKQIELEKKAREEAGMTPEELLARRKGELQGAEGIFADIKAKANADGVITNAEREGMNAQELEIEKRKSEIAGLEDTAVVDR